MNYTRRNTIRLLSRNEGKLKSYESCSDIRAWSHDLNVKDRYLREWMKCDMEKCVIPISTLIDLMRIMTCRSRRKVSPRCHPACASKVLLESICSSCHAMKECLKQNDFDKFFVEEEIETSFWPCERCLEALKGIKMFWRIIMDRIFQVKDSKIEEYERDYNRCESVKSIARVWETEMVQQAMYVKNITPALGTTRMWNSFRTGRETNQNSSSRTSRPAPSEDKNGLKSLIPKPKSPGQSIKSPQLRIKDDKKASSKTSYRKLSKTTSANLKKTDIGCETSILKKDIDEFDAYKKNVEVLQTKCSLQDEEMERLKYENNSLRIELQNVYKNTSWKPSFVKINETERDSNVANSMPKPFEICFDEKHPGAVNNIDSEMIITMKNCKNDNFRHVSLLQVLHKTNDPKKEELNFDGSCCKKEDPLEILTKVKDTFGAIVRREINIINEKKHRPNRMDTDTTFHKINASKSAPSCSTLSSRLCSEVNFESVRDESQDTFHKVINI